MWHSYAQYTYIWLLHYKYIVSLFAETVLHVWQVPMLVSLQVKLRKRLVAESLSDIETSI